MEQFFKATKKTNAVTRRKIDLGCDTNVFQIETKQLIFSASHLLKSIHFIELNRNCFCLCIIRIKLGFDITKKIIDRENFSACLRDTIKKF